MHQYAIVFLIATIAAASFAYGMVKPNVARIARPIMYVCIALMAGTFAFG